MVLSAPTSHPDQNVLTVLGQMGPWLPSCPAVLWTVTLGHLGIVLQLCRRGDVVKCAPEAGLLLAHLPAVAAVLLGGPLGVGY